MSIVTRYLSFDFKASLQKVAKLLTLNTNPGSVQVNVISSICEYGVWSFIVGSYNNDQLTSSMVKQFKINLYKSCIKYKESPVIGIYNFATPFTQKTLATYLTFLACNCIKLYSYVQVAGSPINTGKSSSAGITGFYDTLLILHTDDSCKAFKLFKSTDLTNPAALCTYNPNAPVPIPDVDVDDAGPPAVHEVVGQAFTTFLNGLTQFINKDQIDQNQQNQQNQAATLAQTATIATAPPTVPVPVSTSKPIVQAKQAVAKPSAPKTVVGKKGLPK